GATAGPPLEPLLVDEDDAWEDPELPLPVGATQVMTTSGEVRISSRHVRSPGLGAGAGPGPGGGAGLGVPDPARRGGGPASVGVRVATGVGIGLLLVLVAQFGPVPLLALCALAVLLAAIEGYSALRRAGYRPATLLGLTGTVSLMVGAYLKGETALPLVAVLTMVFALIWYLAGVVRARPVMNIGASMVMFMWVGFLASFAGLLLDPTQFPHRHGVAFLMAAVIAAVGYDVGGFALGRRLGRRPLAPSISPNKTWEGLVGGMLTSLVVTSVVVSQISPWNLKDAILLGVVGAVVAPVGDLCQSMVKRDLEVKDMGTVLPGHGGMLDRIDAILFVLPATYYLVRVLGIG
ncbi:MAG: phosphatidate cytidylyltransferase, partial [Acidimicrobiales bacterium]